MKPEDVPAELVEKGMSALGVWPKGRAREAQEATVRIALAAVLPEHNAHIAELATLIAGILNLAADATEIEHGAPFTWEEVAKKRGRALDEISDRIIAFEPPADRQTTTEGPTT